MKVIILLTLFIFSACVQKDPEPVLTAIGRMGTVDSVKFENNQLIIRGKNLNTSKSVILKNKNNNSSETFQISSLTDNEIIAVGTHNVSLLVSSMFELVVSSAYASTSFNITFSLCSSTLNGKAIDCTVAPTDKSVLAFDANSNSWKPKQINGMTYIGTWDASANTTPGAEPSGSYYIIGVAGTIGGVYSVSIGDWIISNGSAWQKVDNSTAIVSVFGRTGTVTAQEGDYSLDKLSDVDLTTNSPVTGNVLKYDGSHWVPGTVSGSSGGTVTAVSASSPLISSGGNTPSISIQQATTSSNGYLSSTDWNTFNNKQGAIAAGTTSQYFRGDKTWQTLSTDAVTEGATNLYYTGARVLGSVLTGLSTATSAVISASDTLLSSLGKLQAQINNKADTTNLTQTITAATVTGLSAPVAGADATNKTYVDNAISLNASWTKSGSDAYRDTGNIGIGTTSPTFKLDVTGNIRATGQIITGSYSTTTGTIDFDNGNAVTSTFDCGSNLTFSNLRDGGTYTLIITGASTTQCNFNTSIGGDTVTYRFRPTNDVRYASTHTMYSMTRVGNVVYVSWTSGF